MHPSSYILLLSSLALISAKPTIRAQPSCSSSLTTATFDDRAPFPLDAALNPVGVYQGNFYQGFLVIEQLTSVGVIPQSGNIAIVTSIVGQTFQGAPSINAATIDAFSLVDLYFGCEVNDLNSVATIVVPCTVAFTGIKRGDGSQRTTNIYPFQPENPVTSHMTRAAFSGADWEDLMSVQVLIVQALTPGPVNALLLDSITIKNCTF
jgi:hypothetical protein